jgi:hypothetical protein
MIGTNRAAPEDVDAKDERSEQMERGRRHQTMSRCNANLTVEPRQIGRIESDTPRRAGHTVRGSTTF